MLTLNDGRPELWQWDTGRTLAVDSDCSQVHFSNKVFGRSIDVDVIGGTAIIPDILLQADKDLNVWAFVGTAENGYTKISKTFKVNRRNKPADYVFTQTDQMTLQMIQSQIGDLADLTTEEQDTLVAAINEVARTGGGAGSMELRVADGYVQYSADGGMTWTNLIAMADLKGEDGITPTIGSNGNWYLGEEDTGKPSRGATGSPGKDGAGMDVTGAKVGQIAKISAVDASGVPTAWSPADMPSDGSSDFVITGTVTGETLTTDKTYEQVHEAVQAGKIVTLKVEAYGIDLVLPLIGENSSGYLFTTVATVFPTVTRQFSAVVGASGTLWHTEQVASYDSDGNLVQISMDRDPEQPMEIATKQYVDASGVPSVTAADNGKVLRVVNSAWSAEDMQTGGTDMGITGATVGQIAKIAAVDGTGKPTAWEAVDMPSGGGETWEKISDVSLTQDVSSYILASFGSYRKIKIMMERGTYVSGLNKNVWVRISLPGVSNAFYTVGYLTYEYGFLKWEINAEVNNAFISGHIILSNNLNASSSLIWKVSKELGDTAVSDLSLRLDFTDVSVIQDGDSVSVWGVRW